MPRLILILLMVLVAACTPNEGKPIAQGEVRLALDALNPRRANADAHAALAKGDRHLTAIYGITTLAPGAPKSGTISRHLFAACSKKTSRIRASDAASRKIPCPDTAADLTPAPASKASPASSDRTMETCMADITAVAEELQSLQTEMQVAFSAD